MRALTLASLLIAAVLSQPAGEALAQGVHDTVRVTAGSAGGAQSLSLPRGRSAIIDLPVDARDVLVSNPHVADVVLRTPRRIYVMGTAPGHTDAVFFDAAGREILNLSVRIEQDTGALMDAIRRIVPSAHVRAEAMNQSIVLTGTVANAAEADQVVRLAQTYAVGPQGVVNMLSIAGREQVMLRVRVIEVERTVVRQLGFNFQGLLGDVTDPQFVLQTALGYPVNGRQLGGGRFSYNSPSGAGEPDSFSSALTAFERVGLIRTLAEPNLTSVSGEPANFLAGGEFPVPSALSAEGQVTVTFKPFGVGLAFTPVVLSEGRISLKIATEVSELTSTGAFTLGSVAGTITIPALNVRRAQNTVELPSGGSMMIAGLLQERSRQTIERVPGVGQVPIIGALFRSRDFVSGETELVIIVTPYIVRPTSPSQMQTPADGLRTANDAEAILMGRLNGRFRPNAPGDRRWSGPFGWSLD